MFYRIVRPLLYLFMCLFYPHKVYGKENLPECQQVVVCNHFGKIDVFFVGSLYKNKTYFLAKKELFENKLSNKIVRSLGGIPVKRDGVDLECIKEGLKVLKNGDNLAIFPEGRRNRENDDLQPLKPGSAMFAFKAKVPIVPVILEKKAHAFRRCNMLVGKPIYLDEYYGRTYNAELADEMNQKLTEAMLQTQADLRAMLKEKRERKRK